MEGDWFLGKELVQGLRASTCLNSRICGPQSQSAYKKGIVFGVYIKCTKYCQGTTVNTTYYFEIYKGLCSGMSRFDILLNPVL